MVCSSFKAFLFLLEHMLQLCLFEDKSLSQIKEMSVQNLQLLPLSNIPWRRKLEIIL